MAGCALTYVKVPLTFSVIRQGESCYTFMDKVYSFAP